MANMLQENYFYRWTVIFRVIYDMYDWYKYKKIPKFIYIANKKMISKSFYRKQIFLTTWKEFKIYFAL